MGRNRELMTVKYRDGRMLTVREITQLHPELNSNLIRMRILKEGTDDLDKLLRPPTNVKPPEHATISKEALKGLQPRRNIAELRAPSEYEKELWGG